MTKVYILQDNPFAGRNFISAEEYGEIEFLFNSYLAPLTLPKILPQLREKLRNLTSEDWLIPTGSPALIAMAGGVVMEKLGQLNILVWDNQTKTYIPVRIDTQWLQKP